MRGRSIKGLILKFSRRINYSFWLKIGVALLVLFAIIRIFNVDFFDAVKSIEYPYFILLALIFPLIINPIISNNRWKIFLDIQGIHEKFFTLAKISFTSIFLGFLLPSSTGFDAIRIYQIEKRNKNKLGAGGASVIIERLIGFYLLSLLGIIGAWIAQLQGISISILYVTVVINVGLLLVFIALSSKKIHYFIVTHISKIKRGKKIADYFTSAYTSINNFPLKKVLIVSIVLILLFQLSTILCGYLIFRAFGVDLPFYYHLAFMPLIQIISIIPISISGFGLREGGFVYFYSLLGVGSGIAFTVSLLYYIILVITPAAVGMVLYLIDEIHHSRIKKAKSTLI
ncbi:MAG: lysylphosphatidylglycerol synthase transmembrane domain-containing protein [Salinivirgaceae bacterium]|nr:lysylphosphatidylglycerol synthase transmembrane domain-containing protein [Salinivirgaceae bacterium]MDY0279824.1 lysylphosphatidylglycerol synthase transmembrane domain-containing protein [Salinivirgaceae bacterium]